MRGNPVCTVKTIRSSDAIGRIIRGGRRYRSRSLVVFVSVRDADVAKSEGEGRVAYIAPKRLGNAVYRNRCKRLLRAGLQKAAAANPELFKWDMIDIIYMANERTVKASPTALGEEMTAVQKRIISSDNQLV